MKAHSPISRRKPMKPCCWMSMQGDSTLFMRADQVETAWKIIMPVLEYWENNLADDFPNYEAGTWGPPQADELLARNNRSWL
jgi:glucose-6-phosphate 1-dehydrogenase